VSGVAVRELDVLLEGVARGWDGLRIAHISDLHFTRWNRTYQAAQRILAGLDYDVLVVTGDFCDFRWRWRRTVGFIRRFFEPLAARRPVLAVLGNHDHPDLGFEPELPLVFLDNQIHDLQIHKQTLRFAGINQCAPEAEHLAAVQSNDSADAPAVLLAHYPSTAFRPLPGHFQLVMSGHTHGGQIRLPGFGCLWANDRIPRRMACGLHRVNGRHLHVSAGLGVSLPVRIRVNCPPEISVLTLSVAMLTAAESGKQPAWRGLQAVGG
jgi:hypothetical protein